MAATLVRRPPMEAQQPSRAAQRKQRLLELENEQRLEDLEALKMTEEQHLILLHSFRSVKFEWSDLDGLRYVRRRYNSPPVHPRAHSPVPTRASPRPPSVQHQSPRQQPTETFTVLTNRHPAPPGIQVSRPPPIFVPFPEETLPVPFPSAESAPASPTPTITPRDAAWGNLELDVEPTAKPIRTVKSVSSLRTRRVSGTTRARSPIKGLFPTPATPASTTLTVPPPIVVPQLLAAEDDDDDAWVDEEDGDATFRVDAEEKRNDDLATPTAPRSWQFEDVLGVYSAALPPTPTPTNAEAEFHVGGKRKR